MKRLIFFVSLVVCIAPSNARSADEQQPIPISSSNIDDFRKKSIMLSDGLAGQVVTFPSRSPTDFAPMLRGELGPEIILNAQFFRPVNLGRKVPVVILVPGSANIGPHHLLQAAALTKVGIAVLVIDPFSGRGLTDSVSDQSRFSWAASVFDVVAALKYLRSRTDVDGERIGALGGSRGGTAAMMAAYRPISEALIGKRKGLRVVVAGYPWCGTQFRSSQLANETRLLVMSGDKDDWVSVQQCQAATTALAVAGGRVQMQLIKDGLHAFDRGDVAPRRIEQAVTSTNFPIVYLNDVGQYFDLYSASVDPLLTGADLMQRSIDGGFLHRGVTIGSTGNQAQHYTDTMVEFFSELKADQE